MFIQIIIWYDTYMKTIAIGTKNPIKIAAVQAVLCKFWQQAEYVCIEVPSDVSEQPMSSAETREGAINRARHAKEQAGALIGVGLEGGVEDTPDGMFIFGWVAIVGEEGELGVASSCWLPLPEVLAGQLREGKELGPVIDEFMGTHGLSHSRGTFGVLTNDQISRQQAFEQALICACARFMNPKFFQN